MYITLNEIDYYAYTGTHELDPQKETIVFIHGATMDHSVWSHQSRYLAYHGYNVVAVDLPGHKFSGGVPPTSIQDMAAWLNQIIEQCPGKCVHLVGHSMGSLAALETAATYGEKNPDLCSISLVGFSYPMSVTPQLMDAARNNPSEAHAMMIEWSHTSKIGGEPIPGFWARGMQMSMMENSKPGSVHAGLLACDSYRNGEEAFQKITCPILFLCGRLDKMAPAKLAKQEADRNKNATIVMIPHCGHSIMAESPDGVLRELKQFIGSNAC